jgi:UDP:flavonoid glycosyltransferase YjiC (YdhE family)
LEVEKWLNGSSNVIFAAFGSIAEPKASIVQAIVEGVGALKDFKLLFAFSGQVRPEWKAHSHVRFEKWVNQKMVLHNSNVKVFITHAGVQSLVEAIQTLQPVLCIPHFGDQLANAGRAIDRGIGLGISKTVVTTATIRENLQRIIDERPKFVQAIEFQRRLLKWSGGAEQSAKVIEKILDVGWEYLITEDKKMPYWRAHNFDVLLAYLAIFASIWYSLKFLCCSMCFQGIRKAKQA